MPCDALRFVNVTVSGRLDAVALEAPAGSIVGVVGLAESGHRDALAARSSNRDAYVDQSLANLTLCNAPFQDLITRYAWGEIWGRPGLPHQTRSLITLAMLVALNRGDELRMHIRAALRNSVTIEEIQEVFLQCAIYCGVPAANAAFHLAADVLATNAPDQETERGVPLAGYLPGPRPPGALLSSLSRYSCAMI